MIWNNRIIQTEHDTPAGPVNLYGLHETYYNKAGGITSFTCEPMGGHYETVDDLLLTLAQQLSDAIKRKDNIIVAKGFAFASDDPADAASAALTARETKQPKREINPPPPSMKIFYAQLSRTSDVQNEEIVTQAGAGNLCPLFCEGQAVGWIKREHTRLLPQLNALTYNQPRPVDFQCPKCQGTEWRYMGCYAIDEFSAQNGFECMGCYSRQYECFDYRRRPDLSVDRITGDPQDSGAEPQLGSPS